jgi:hypothetical protein
LIVSNRAVELGLTTTLGIIHDGRGQLKPLNDIEQQIYWKLRNLGKRSWTRFYKFQDNIALGKANNWSCRSGSRYLYICEDGLVHYCSQQRGYPGVPLSEYTLEDCRREFNTKKYCAPYCTVACAHVVATFDNWRAGQTVRAFDPRAHKAPEKQPEAVSSLADLNTAAD